MLSVRTQWAFPRPWLSGLLLVAVLAGPSAPAAASRGDTPQGDLVLVKKRERAPAQPEPRQSWVLLKGTLGWLVAGGIGTLVPLVLFALPVIGTPSLGPYWVPFLVVAVLWGTLMTAAGGALVWLILAAFSDTRSGFLVPIAVAALIGIIGTLLAGALALLVSWPFFALAAFRSGKGPYYYAAWNSLYASPFSAGGALLAFVVWSLGVIATSITAPLVAAWVYSQLGLPREGNAFHLDIVTGRDLLGDAPGKRSGKQSFSGPSAGRRSGNRSRASDDGDERAPAQRRPARRGVGNPCRGDGDCTRACATVSDFASMCTQPCSAALPCPADTACVDEGGGLCAPTCVNDADCAALPGFVCRPHDVLGGREVRVCQRD